MSNKTCLLLVLALIAAALTGCRSAPVPAPQDTPPPVATSTAAAPPAAPSEAPPTAAPPAAPSEAPPTGAAPSAAPPTDVPPTAAPTEAPPTAAAPTETAPADAAPTGAPAPATPTGAGPTAAPGAAKVALQAGAWAGGGSGVSINFDITYENNQPMLGNVAVLWFGPGACMLDHRLTSVTPISDGAFTRFYDRDDAHFTLIGKAVSPTQVEGAFQFHVTGCSNRTISWSARPVGNP